MQIKSSEDIDAPIGEAFDVLSDFEVFERAAIRRGVDVRRLNDHSHVVEGLEWLAAFQVRGRPQEVHLQLRDYERPSLMRFLSATKGFDGAMLVELLALSPRRTRMIVTLKLRANTLSGRLFVQSLKLARRKLVRKFNARLAEFAKDVQSRCKRRA